MSAAFLVFTDTIAAGSSPQKNLWKKFLEHKKKQPLLEPLSKLNHHQHTHIILWQVSKLYLFLCDFCKKNVYSCKQGDKCCHKQPKAR